MFPEWPRAISEFLMNWIRRDYNKIAGEISTIESIEKRTKLNKEELSGVICLNCNNKALTGSLLNLKCNVCSLTAERKTTKAYNKKLGVEPRAIRKTIIDQELSKLADVAA